MAFELKTDFQKDIWRNRYSLPEENNWADMSRRVSQAVAKAENESLVSEWSNKFFDVINNGDFIPGGRILRNAGRRRQAMLNCFITETDDNIQDLSDFIKLSYLIGVYEGGQGYIVNVRPMGASVAGVDYAAPGATSIVKLIDGIGEHTRAGGGRRSAIWAGLDITHPDCLYWIDLKKNKSIANNHNISVIINNDFLDAIKNDKEWIFSWDNKQWYIFELTVDRVDGTNSVIDVVAPNSEYAIGISNLFLKKHFKDVFSNPKRKKMKARHLWDKIIQNASHDAGGEPGLVHRSLIEENFTANYIGKWIGQNACTEVTGCSPGDVCCLGALNLPNFYDPTTNDIDYKKFQDVIHASVRFLDNVLTLNHFPSEIIQRASHKTRRIGLGFMGFAHLLIKMGIRYGSQKCVNFMNRFMTTMRNEAYKASIELAKEKGTFPAFNAAKHLENQFIKQLPASIRKDINKFGLRNVAMLLLAPTGTTSSVMNTSSSIEPIFAPVYKRKYRKGEVFQEEVLIDPLFEEFLQKGITPNYFVGAYDVTVEEHLKVLSTAQTYLDQAISKTNNIPKDFKDENLSNLILEYMPYIKTLTLYREGSRPDEPLNPIRIGSDEFKQIIKEKYKIEASSQDCLTGVCEI